MPMITLKLKTQETEANLQANDISEANVEHIIRGVFSVFGITEPQPAAPPSIAVALPPTPVIAKTVQAAAITQEEEEYDQEKLMAEMEQREKELKENPPEFWKTGIKMKSLHGVDVPHYRTHYKCPNPKCRKSSRHYSPADAKYVTCHDCSTKIAIKKATMKGIPDRDPQGNFFVADSHYVEAK